MYKRRANWKLAPWHFLMSAVWKYFKLDNKSSFTATRTVSRGRKDRVAFILPTYDTWKKDTLHKTLDFVASKMVGQLTLKEVLELTDELIALDDQPVVGKHWILPFRWARGGNSWLLVTNMAPPPFKRCTCFWDYSWHMEFSFSFSSIVSDRGSNAQNQMTRTRTWTQQKWLGHPWWLNICAYSLCNSLSWQSFNNTDV